MPSWPIATEVLQSDFLTMSNQRSFLGKWWSNTKWSLLGTTSSNQRQMRWKRQLRPQASTIHRETMPSTGEYKHVPLFHLYHKAVTRASPPGNNEMLDQGGPLVRKAAHTHAIGNKVCFSVMKGAVIPNHEEFCTKLCLRIRVTCTTKGANPDLLQ